MLTRTLLLVLGLFHCVSALWMITAQASWYAVPAVTRTGPMNYHFIIDIALAFLASGAGMMLGFRRGTVAIVIALTGSMWPALHGLFHIWCWCKHGVPRDFGMAATELFGVILTGLLGLGLAVSRARKEGVI